MSLDVFTQSYSQLGIPTWLLTISLIWSLIWKGLALWKSARRSSTVWFIVLLVVNTLGILEILYIFLFSEMKFGRKKQARRPVTRAKTRKPVKKIAKKRKR